jgi:hypothetical protein
MEPDMKKALQVLNRLESRGIISKWAIGGATGLNCYSTPVETSDLDVFVFFEPPPGMLLVSLSPLYEALRQMGYEAEREHVIIEGIPVQFLDAAHPLEKDALENARSIRMFGEPAKVLSAEHLVMLMIKTWRPKDRIRFATLTWDNPGFYSGHQVAALARRFHLEAEYARARRALCRDE